MVDDQVNLVKVKRMGDGYAKADEIKVSTNYHSTSRTLLSPTYPGLIVSRFIAGYFAGLPISNVGATAADLYPTSQTSWPIIIFAFTSQVLGPDLGPVIGGAIFVGTGTLRWRYWTCLIFGMLTFLWSLTFGETLHDKVYEKATGIKQKRSATSHLKKELFRLFYLLVTEPIIIALALTTTYLFSLIYIYLQGLLILYTDEYSFNST